MNYYHWTILAVIWCALPSLFVSYPLRNHIRYIQCRERCSIRSPISCAFKVDDDETNVLKTRMEKPNIPTTNALDYSIRPAAFHDLGAVAKLRIHVFYPQVCCRFYRFMDLKIKLFSIVFGSFLVSRKNTR